MTQANVSSAAKPLVSSAAKPLVSSAAKPLVSDAAKPLVSSAAKPLGWLGIVRLGMVQSALGAIVALCTSTLNRVMVVEMALPAMLPAALVGIHFAVQMTRPRWGYGSDVGNRRSPWIIGGMGVLCLGALGATDATLMMPGSPTMGMIMSVISYILIGLGVGAAGTSLLALMATRVLPERRAAAASITWIMMVFGIVVSSIVVGKMIEPFSAQALAFAATGLAGFAFLTTVVAVYNTETDAQDNAGLAGGEVQSAGPEKTREDFMVALRQIWAEPLARRFTIFVFLSMLAYSAQDLILEPFAGLVFNMTPGQSTQLSGMQHGGVLLGMILTGVLGGRSSRGGKGWMQTWAICGCIGSAAALAGLGAAALVGPAWPLKPTVFFLGFANGVFAVSAIGSMMGLAGAGRNAREGTRMGIWGAAQAIAFGLGGFIGAVGVDAMRVILPETGEAFFVVFAIEAALFVGAAILASRLKVSSLATSDHGIGAQVASS
jgi:MFS transporter, BCD family, chlorophyll transporter